MKNKYEIIGSRIKDARETASISQQALADALGYDSATAISLFESGKRKVTVEELQKMASIFHRDIKFFLGEEVSIPDVRHALRADKDLAPEDEKEILNFINFVKNKKHGK